VADMIGECVITLRSALLSDVYIFWVYTVYSTVQIGCMGFKEIKAYLGKCMVKLLIVALSG
jgi:hypothetical protein